MVEESKNYAPLNKETEKMLRDFFRPYNEKLENLLGFKFGWE